MIGNLIINGINSQAYGVYISEAGTYDAPVRNYDNFQIPGRSGDLIIDRGTFSNVEITYQAFIQSNFGERFREWRNFLAKQSGYLRIADTFHTGEYRKGKLRENIKIISTAQDQIGAFAMIFDCAPQRYLNSGEEPVEFTESGSISNEYQPSDPVIRVYGHGEVGIGSQIITIASHPYEYIDIDSEIMDCHYGSTNCNQYVSPMEQYPKLATGATGITLGEEITMVEITPRWWML